MHKCVCVCVCLWALGSVLMYSTYNNRPLWDKEKAWWWKICKLLITTSNLHTRMYSDSQEVKNSKELSAVYNLCYSVTWLISERYVRQKGKTVRCIWYLLPSWEQLVRVLPFILLHLMLWKKRGLKLLQSGRCPWNIQLTCTKGWSLSLFLSSLRNGILYRFSTQ